MTKTFEQPAANEARPSGDEQASAIESEKIVPGKLNDRIEILRKGPAPSFPAPSPLGRFGFLGRATS